jgi:alginate O-acetyltransferase complex protein AlgI
MFESLSLVTRFAVYATGVVALWLLTRITRERRTRQLIFLFASYAFYATWGVWFLGILLFSSVGNYVFGRYLRRKPSAGRLWAGIVFNVALLSVFKYLPALGHIVVLHDRLPLLSHIVLPLGISFWTFQAMSYLIDLYREEELDPSLLEFCLYMAFWPTVFSGPVCRLPQLLPQLRKPIDPRWEEVGLGLQRIFIGLLLMGAAQLLALGLSPGSGVNAGFDRPAAALGGVDVWVLLLGYGFQLFFDFAGYSHLVIGAARLFGIELPENFNRPYLSTSPSTFWTRWHMSLSFWIRDYVFMPLATARPQFWWRSLSLVMAMFLFGLWHRGSVMFMVWGTYHGLLLVAHRSWQQLQRRWGLQLAPVLENAGGWALTFATITLGWAFFRSDDLTQAFALLKNVFSPGRYRTFALHPHFYLLVGLSLATYFSVIALGGFLNRIEDRRTESTGTPRVPVTVSSLLGAMARERWVWVGPLVIVISIYVYVLVRPQGVAPSPFVYRIF